MLQYIADQESSQLGFRPLAVAISRSEKVMQGIL